MAEITLESLQKQMAEMAENQKRLAEENQSLKKELADIAAQGIKAVAEEEGVELKVPTDPITYKGKQYRFAAAGYRRTGDEVVSAREIAADEGLIAEILKVKGQGILVEQA